MIFQTILKSNMDRFIAFVEEQINSAFKYLKSNMDRFIAVAPYTAVEDFKF